jgi:small subunit ribosomal protein S16
LEWLGNGAQPTDTVRKILSSKGVLFLKHLLRGVDLGLFDHATAMTKFEAWHQEQEAKGRARYEAAARERRQRRTPAPAPRAPKPAPQQEQTEEPTAE